MKLKITIFIFTLLILNSNQAFSYAQGYPKIMGMNIGNPTNYDNTLYQKEMSKADALVMNFWPHWKEYKYGANSIRKIVQNIKKLNSSLLIGQYTILNEAQDSKAKDQGNIDRALKIEAEDWWLRDASGNKVQWTKDFEAWDINITDYAKPDKQGLRYPEWLAQRNYDLYFKNVPEFSFWYLDNSLNNSPISAADWQNKKVNLNSTTAEMAKAYRLGNIKYWQTIFSLQPNTLLVGNSDNLSSPEYRLRLNGGFLEAMIGKSWSLETWKGWKTMLARYYDFMDNTAAPKLTGFNVWGKVNDYQRMRYGLTSCLMNNGYFSYTDETKGYASLPWFDEYDAKLGKPLDLPPVAAWQNGVYKREFENGVVYVNPTSKSVNISNTATLFRIAGKQVPSINSGKLVGKEFTLPSKDGIIFLKSTNAKTMRKI